MTLMAVSRWGIGTNFDSTVYICAASNFLKGQGLSVAYPTGEKIPVSHYPPLFSMLLAGIMAIGIDSINAAGWLNSILYGANILIIALLINAYTRSLLISLFGSFLFLSSTVILFVHSMAWSEPLFIFAGFLGLYLLAFYLRDQKLSFLIPASAAISLAFLSRYIGVSLVLTGLIGILIFNKKAWIKGLIDTIIFIVISCTPMILWVVRNTYVSFSATSYISCRQIVFHPVTLEHLKAAVGVISSWALPGRIPPFLRAAIIGAALGSFGLYLILKKKKIGQDKKDYPRESLTSLPTLMTSFILIYVASLIISISFVDAHTHFTDRILSPAYISALIIILYILNKLLPALKRSQILSIICVIFLFAFSVLSIHRATSFLSNVYSNGLGYANKQWQQSETIKKVRNLNPQTLVFSNAPDAIYILTGKYTHLFPIKINPCTQLASDNYLSELASMRQKLKNMDGLVIYFNTVTFWFLPSESELREKLPLRLIAREADASIYKVRN